MIKRVLYLAGGDRGGSDVADYPAEDAGRRRSTGRDCREFSGVTKGLDS